MKIQDLEPGTQFIYSNQLCIKLNDSHAIDGYSAFYNTAFNTPIVSYLQKDAEITQYEQTRKQ